MQFRALQKNYQTIASNRVVMQEGRPKVRWLTPDVVKVTVDLQCEKDPSARLLHAPYQTWTKEEKEKLEKKKAATPEASAAKKLPSSVTASTDEETPAKRRKIETPKEGKRPGEGKPWELKEKNHRLAIIVPYRNQPEQNRLPQLEEFASVMPVLLRKVRRFSVAWATSIDSPQILPSFAEFIIIIVEQQQVRLHDRC